MTKKEIVNLTPHEVVVRVGEKNYYFAKSGNVLRAEIPMQPTEPLGDIPLRIKRNDMAPNEVILPVKVENRLYIVSTMLLDMFPERDDFIAPDTSKDAVIRDSNYRIVGVKGFQTAYRKEKK